MQCTNDNCKEKGPTPAHRVSMAKGSPSCANCKQALQPEPPTSKPGRAVEKVIPITQELPNDGAGDAEFDRRISAAPESVLEMMIAETTTGRHKLGDANRVEKVQAEIDRRKEKETA